MRGISDNKMLKGDLQRRQMPHPFQVVLIVKPFVSNMNENVKFRFRIRRGGSETET